jgi:hypothetical protein
MIPILPEFVGVTMLRQSLALFGARPAGLIPSVVCDNRIKPIILIDALSATLAEASAWNPFLCVSVVSVAICRDFA